MILNLFISLLLLACSQDSQPPAYDYGRFYEAHEVFRESSITDRRFKQQEIVPLIEELEAPFRVRVAGQSIEGRDIYHVRLGEGATSVLLWSQMHGDEPTATMALMDIFNFFQASGDGFDDYRRDILSKLTLHFLPMLNPDGAELFQRRNAIDIDLNRDALRLTSPEAQLLKQIRDETEADWGFNLHDQSFYYAVGNNPKQASISFLAPAYNYAKQVNAVRGNAMKLIAGLNEVVQKYLPGQVGKYSDGFEPRAFGDNIQKWGTSTILIETGGLYGDPEKQELRRINFTVLLSAFEQIANRRYAGVSTTGYNKIPFNNYGAFQDLILRGVEVPYGDNWYTVDLAFQHREVEYDEHSTYYNRSRITDVGHLSNFFAFRDLPAQEYRAVPAKTHPQRLPDVAALGKLDLLSLIREGVLNFEVEEWPRDNRFHTLPIRLLPKGRTDTGAMKIGDNPTLLLQNDGQTHYAVVNGFLYDLREQGQLQQLLSVLR